MVLNYSSINNITIIFINKRGQPTNSLTWPQSSGGNVYLLVIMKLKTEKSNQANVGLLLNIYSLLIIDVHFDFGPYNDDIQQY